MVDPLKGIEDKVVKYLLRLSTNQIVKRNIGVGGGFNYLEKAQFDIMPEEFLNFSKSDAKFKSKKFLVNSLSNAKRAINCQIDLLIWFLGFEKKSKKEGWSFPKKINFLNNLGILSPNVLNKINKKRNLLEHEYDLPSKTEIEDAIDITDLFIQSTKKLIKNKIYDSIELDMWISIRHLNKNYRIAFPEIYYSKQKHLFEIRFYIRLKQKNKKIKSLEKKAIIELKDPRFPQLMKKFIEFILSN